MTTEIFFLRGPLPGPTVAIFGGVHGNEPCGVRLVDELRKGFAPKRGTLVLAYGNPEAIARGVRQVGANLNRLFLPETELSAQMRAAPEFARSRELMVALESCEALLDVHSSPTQDSPPFVICESNADGLARMMPFPIRCAGFARVEAGGTDGYMYRAGKVGICVECGQHDAPSSLARAREAAYVFLAAYGMAEAPGLDDSRKQAAYRADFAYLTRTADFRVARPFRDFEEVPAGELLGTDGGVPVRAPFNAATLFARDRDLPGVEAFVLAVAG